MINKVLFVGRGGCPERNTAELMWHRINEGAGFHTFRTGRRQQTSRLPGHGFGRVSPLELPPAPLVHELYVLPLRSSQDL